MWCATKANSFREARTKIGIKGAVTADDVGVVLAH